VQPRASPGPGGGQPHPAPGAGSGGQSHPAPRREPAGGRPRVGHPTPGRALIRFLRDGARRAALDYRRPTAAASIACKTTFDSGGRTMELVNEITARLENKPGRLAKICSALAHEKVDVLAISVMESDGPSVLRLVTSDPDAARRILT